MFSVCDLESLYTMPVSGTLVILGGIYAPRHLGGKTLLTSALYGWGIGDQMGAATCPGISPAN